jgi:hypothetical protein
MDIVKAAGVALIVLGVIALAFGSFSYNRETHAARLGSFELTVTHRRTVDVPVWAGVGAIVLGGVLVVMRRE